MAGAGSALAEAYLMAKLHNYNTNNTTSDERRATLVDDHHDTSSKMCSCFPSLFKKIHPNNVLASPRSHSSPRPSHYQEKTNLDTRNT